MVGGDEPHGADPEDTASHVERTMEQVNGVVNNSRPHRTALSFAPFFHSWLIRSDYWVLEERRVCGLFCFFVSSI